MGRRGRRIARVGAAGVALALGGGIAWEAWRWPDTAALARKNPPTTAFIERYRAARRAAGQSDRVDWRWVPYERISPHLKHAVVVAEDIDFFSHAGFSAPEIRAAVAEAIAERAAPRGASTITQQLAKNLWLSPSRDPLRKVKEAILTWQVERRLSKRRILELYLNVVEFGPGVWGAEAAARRYFGASAAGLGRRQAAALAAGLPRPRDWHPGSKSRTYEARIETIERRMEKAQWVRREL